MEFIDLPAFDPRLSARAPKVHPAMKGGRPYPSVNGLSSRPKLWLEIKAIGLNFGRTSQPVRLGHQRSESGGASKISASLARVARVVPSGSAWRGKKRASAISQSGLRSPKVRKLRTT